MASSCSSRRGMDGNFVKSFMVAIVFANSLEAESALAALSAATSKFLTAILPTLDKRKAATGLSGGLRASGVGKRLT